MPVFHYTGLSKRDLCAGLFHFAINPNLRIVGGGNSRGGLVARSETTTSIFPLQPPQATLGSAVVNCNSPACGSRFSNGGDTFPEKKTHQNQLVALRIGMMVGGFTKHFPASLPISNTTFVIFRQNCSCSHVKWKSIAFQTFHPHYTHPMASAGVAGVAATGGTVGNASLMAVAVWCRWLPHYTVQSYIYPPGG